MMKISRKPSKKSEKGQVLVFLALTIVGLVAIIGLAVDMGYVYVNYARLRRGVDAAALAGTGEFKIPVGFNPPCDSTCVTARDNNIYAAAKQMLDLNQVTPDPTATFSDPLTNTYGMAIQTCENTPGDAVLCSAPLQKIIRVKVQERVPLFFLGVIGLRDAPLIVDSIATAASADVMLTIDTSESMTFDSAVLTANRDPKVCNVGNSCHPFAEVKAAAQAFADELYYPYDRVGVMHFDQYAWMTLPLSDTSSDIQAAIDSLKVFEGVNTPLSDGTSSGTKCIYFRDYKNIDPATTGGVDYSTPWEYNPNANYWDFNYRANNVGPPQKLVEYPSGSPDPINYSQDPYGPCRLYDADGGGFLFFDCPQYYGNDGTHPNPSRCGTTNIGGGIDLATRALTGVYPAYSPTPWPVNREDSIWVLVLLTDGAATAAYDTNGNPVCPTYTWAYTYGATPCRDKDATVRHASGDPYYDADDQARDMFDITHSDNISIYTIGLGNQVVSIPSSNTGPPPGETLLKYPETELGNGKYFFAYSASDLLPAFLEIASLITSRINQ